ncbi:MAG: DegT/DnrJ/EryC1/StrS family aminotransferase [Bacteroidia bacterium]|nr:DegT/DnrJ/EryC1/StrS family aminotransferase [Bacteroidia bacterium]MDW8301705.1 DegT/DnrJ/EryC1/StrS family aminotransferase [Bacteroidia bacterium]
MYVPFFKPNISDKVIENVTDALKSGWLTTGKYTQEFEQAFSQYKNGAYCVGLTSCTAALHLAMIALDLPKEAEVIVPTLTFPSTATMALHSGLRVVFAEIDPNTLTICPQDVERKITPKTKAIIAVHLAGNMCDMQALTDIAQKHDLLLIEDCAHAIESTYQGYTSGTIGDVGAFSFYATKNLTTAEGGMLVTKNAELAYKVRLLRSHGIDKEIWKRRQSTAYQQYDVLYPGFKYNMFDLQAAMGIAQLQSLSQNYLKRKALYENYVKAFCDDSRFELVSIQPNSTHAYHLFILKLNLEVIPYTRDMLMFKLKERGIETSVHFFPVPLYSYYKQTFGYTEKDFAVSYQTYLRLISLPLYPDLSVEAQQYVIDTLKAILS